MTVDVVTQKARTGIYKPNAKQPKEIFRYSILSLSLFVFGFSQITLIRPFSFNDFAFFANRFY